MAIKPSTNPKLQLGTILVTGQQGLIVFDFFESRLGFTVEDDEVQLISLIYNSLKGEELLRIVDNRVAFGPHEVIQYDQQPGHLRLSAPCNDRFIPFWALAPMRVHEPDYPPGGRLTLLEIEVREPGLVQVQGVWANKRHAFVITQNGIHSLSQGMVQPLTITGEEGVILEWRGSIDTAMFDFGPPKN
jgi:hypothetical protein